MNLQLQRVLIQLSQAYVSIMINLDSRLFHLAPLIEVFHVGFHVCVAKWETLFKKRILRHTLAAVS